VKPGQSYALFDPVPSLSVGKQDPKMIVKDYGSKNNQKEFQPEKTVKNQARYQ